MEYTQDDYLMISGIQHFKFCRRQWALIHIEQQWEENYRTVDGAIMHKNAHDDGFREKRGKVLITRGMAISSPVLGLSGECDIVEFHRADSGIPITGEKGLYRVVPIEYKIGKPKNDECDKMQLAAQAMCLEDMLCCDIEEGFLYYGETRHRLKVSIDEKLRSETRKVVDEMHSLYQKGHTPRVRRTKSCNACSLKNVCLPGLGTKKTASSYLKSRLKEEENHEEVT